MNSPDIRDIEILSAYLDGQLDESERTRLESRIVTDTELASTLEGLRRTQALLRRIPQRRAPRNFTLNLKMVKARTEPRGWYSIFNLASVLATLLFFMIFAADLFHAPLLASAPSLERQAASESMGIGGGCEGCDITPEAALIAPAATEAAAAASDAQITPTPELLKTTVIEMPPTESAAPIEEPQPEFPWQAFEIGLLIVAIGAGGAAYWMRRNSR
jgi:hypothetical protein